ncbi:helix-turn-helix domain-containing protein [Planosporangium flavigriseum]|uniref:helix-turn-helix domain-containing protein n=1 Tax=Planosporangium flavigriseum TaxID=373681 RepID=UPI00194DB657|nr:helix-turn-helix transcriptional regulator [Planosporangium flavigriseum]
MQDDERIGTRIAARRKMRGLTGRQLADRAHVSYSLLTKVETGRVPASPALVAAVARALGVSTAALTGQPYSDESRTAARLHAAIPDIRREMAAYRLPPADVEQVQPRTTTELAAAVAQVSKDRHAARFDRMAAALPSLLVELRAATHLSNTSTERGRLYGLLAEAYAATGQLVYKLGYPDLSAMTTDRYEWSAERSGNRLAQRVGDWYRAGELIATGDWGVAELVLRGARADLGPELGDGEATLAVYGALHLKSALVYARAGNAANAWSHHAEAARIATQIGVDRDDYRLAFGPTNAAIWGVGLAVELNDGPAAVTRAHDVRIGPGTPPERTSHHYIDLARGWLYNGDRGEKALACLNTARRLAPQQTRNHPMVRETLLALARVERRSTGSLREFTHWVGLEGRDI